MEEEAKTEGQPSTESPHPTETGPAVQSTPPSCEKVEGVPLLSLIRRSYEKAKSRTQTFFGADAKPTVEDGVKGQAILLKWEPSSRYRDTEFFTEINDTLKWVQDRAAALGVMAFGLANWLWFDFVSYYNIPIGIFSPALLSALPSILASVVVIVLMLSAGALTPAMVLGTPLSKNGPALIDFRGRTTSDGESHCAVDGWNRWLQLSVLSAILWASTFVGGSLIAKGNDSTAVGTTMVITMLITIAGGSWFLTRGTPRGRSKDFWLTTVMGLLLQNYLLLVALLAALSFVDQLTWGSAALPIAAYLAITTFTAAGQCIGANIRRKHGFRRGVLARALVISGISLWALAFLPIIGGPLASLPIRVTSSGARACLVMSLHNDSGKPFDARLLAQGEGNPQLDPKDKSSTSFVKSKELSMAPLLDGTYYLKLRNGGSGEFFLISKDAVSAIEGCPKPAKSQKLPQQAEQKPDANNETNKQTPNRAQ